MREATVVTDGSFLRPGCAGWAAWIIFDDGEIIRRSGLVPKSSSVSSLYAELYAANMGWRIAREAGAYYVDIASDCMGLARWFPDMIHVKGHSGARDELSAAQQWCDALARKEARTIKLSRRPDKTRRDVARRGN